MFVAKPGTAKACLLCDMGLHIAAGKDWYGRKVKQGLVVFFAAERKPLTERRVDAWTKHYGLSGFPFVVIGGKLDLTTGVIDAKLLAATIKACEEKMRFQVCLDYSRHGDSHLRRWGSASKPRHADGTSNRLMYCTGRRPPTLPRFIILLGVTKGAKVQSTLTARSTRHSGSPSKVRDQPRFSPLPGPVPTMTATKGR